MHVRLLLMHNAITLTTKANDVGDRLHQRKIILQVTGTGDMDEAMIRRHAEEMSIQINQSATTITGREITRTIERLCITRSRAQVMESSTTATPEIASNSPSSATTASANMSDNQINATALRHLPMHITRYSISVAVGHKCFTTATDATIPKSRATSPAETVVACMSGDNAPLGIVNVAGAYVLTIGARCAAAINNSDEALTEGLGSVNMSHGLGNNMPSRTFSMIRTMLTNRLFLMKSF